MKPAKLCKYESCEKRANFDFPDGKGRFCFTHKENGMVDVKNKHCEVSNCYIRAIFDFPDGKGRFCFTHKENGMVDISSKQCEIPSCRKKPSYNFRGNSKAKFCVDHKENGMIDVKNKHCEVSNCDMCAIFDIPGGKGRFCSVHKKEEMVNVRHKRCEAIGCNKYPSYNFNGQTIAKFCISHKKDEMVDVRNKKCIMCPTHVRTYKYKGYCYRCFIHIFPDNTIVRNHKTKERNIADFLRENLPEYDMIFDKRIDGGCSGKRPDILIDMGTHTVIVEIDENQHHTYDCSCENKRLMQLFQDIGGNRPMIMIRFNPDNYISYDGTNISSCWGITKDKGLYKIKESKKKEWEIRLNTLKNVVKLACTEKCHKEIEMIHLYYDER